jgi:L,D-transpeptidase ErfK/SrfK
MRVLLSICTILGLIFSANIWAHATYGKKYCKQSGYHCLRIERGDTWSNLFPNTQSRNVVKKLNRMNTPLKPNYIIAVPNNLNRMSHMDIAPMPHRIHTGGQPIVKVNLSNLSWGAYDASGKLQNWGPVSGGQNYCPDVNRACKTIVGKYTFYRKQGPGCKSSKYPRPNGGAPMPYCMHFKGGYAMHASTMVPGHNASHGCVRLFHEDAQWLNQNFVHTGRTKVEIVR